MQCCNQHSFQANGNILISGIQRGHLERIFPWLEAKTNITPYYDSKTSLLYMARPVLSNSHEN